MKQRIMKCIAFILALILVMPLIPSGNGVFASAAAKPAMSIAKKTIAGLDASFSLNALNSGKKAKKFYWYSSNKKVATVEPTKDLKTAKVTTVGRGTTDIKCRITYESGKNIYLTCKVTVQIPATGVEITNANDTELNNNRHVIQVGESFDFNRTLTPSNANDTIYWTFDKEGYATVISNGTVTGVKPGFIRLTATASLTKSGAATSRINDGVNIEIIAKTANVKTVSFADATTLNISFDRPMDGSTMIGTDKKLLDTVIITQKTNEANTKANAIGEMTAVLSADGKILSINTKNNFEGLYGIRLYSNIKATDGTILSEFNQDLEYYDKNPPYYTSYTVDDSGLLATINFSEAMDFTSLTIEDVKVMSPATEMNMVTKSILSQKVNYIKSEDSKSLTIDLRLIPETDKNKTFSVIMAGITDLTGNPPLQYPHPVYLKTDTTPRPQAKLISLERTSYDTLTATYDRAIQSVGTLILSNNERPVAIVDKDDPKKVNYTLSASAVLLTGVQKVYVGLWNSYNVVLSDTSANTIKEYPSGVNFSLDKTQPVFLKSELKTESINGADHYTLILTYSENVTLAYDSGILSSKLVTNANDIYSNKSLIYTAYAKDAQVFILMSSEQLLDSGTYSITLPAYFVRDGYMNYSYNTVISVKKDAAASSALPAPKTILQSAENPSIVEVYFSTKVDEITSQTVSNYHIAGVSIQSAELLDNTVTGARVRLTITQGTINYSTSYPVTISRITGYHNTYTAMTEYKGTIYLNENIAPSFIGATYSLTNPLTLTLTFTEALIGTPSFKVLQGGNDLVYNSMISGNTVIIVLKSVPTASMQVVPNLDNGIKDIVGNPANIPSSYNVPLKY